MSGSVQFSRSVMSDPLWPHGLQHARLPCPSPAPGACSNSCPSSRWCHPTISSSVVPISCLQSFPALGSFPVSWFFTLGGQNFGASVSESVPPVNIQDWFPLGLTGLISLQSKGLSSIFSSTTVWKHQFFSTKRLPWWLRWLSVCLQCGRPRFDPWVGKIHWRRKWQSTPVLLPRKSHGQSSLVGYSTWGHKELDTTEWLHFHFQAFFMVQLSHLYMTTGKTVPLTRRTFVSKVMSLLFNMLFRFVTAFLPRSEHLLISWLQSPSAVILEPKKIKSITASIVSPSICHEVMGPDAMIFVFWMLSFKPAFSVSSFTFINRLFSSSLLSAIRVVSSTYWGYWYFSWQSWFQLVLHPTQHFAWCTLHIS